MNRSSRLLKRIFDQPAGIGQCLVPKGIVRVYKNDSSNR